MQPDQPSLFDLDQATAAASHLIPLGEYVAVADTASTSIQDQFEAFHQANPWVYTALIALARDLRDRNPKRIGIKMLFEVLRWQYWRSTTDPSGSTFKLNNNYTSRYARLIEASNPDLAGAFEVRAIRTP